jgi:hypothetical protein
MHECSKRWKKFKIKYRKFFYFLVIVLILRVLEYRKIIKENKNRHNILNEENNSIMCMVLTTETNILTRGIAVWETYGQEFRDIVFACNCPNIMEVKNLLKNNKKIPSKFESFINAAKLPILNLNVTEKVEKMADKVFVVLKESYDIYKSKSNWFVMIDDDGYIFYDNLQKFIKTKNTTVPEIYGFKFTHTKDVVKGLVGHVAGGPGIIFTNESMNRLYYKIINNECTSTTIFQYGDFAISLCGFYAGLSIGESRDEYGKQRFHNYDPFVHYYGPLPFILKESDHHSKKIGKECCSLDTVSFHYLNHSLMYKIHQNKTFLKDLLT